MKVLRWTDIFKLVDGNALDESGYKIEVIKPGATVLELICAWCDYTERCDVTHIQVLLIDDTVFPSDYIAYDCQTDNISFPVRNYINGPSKYAKETWQSLAGKRVAKHGSFFRIPVDRYFFDLYLRLEEDFEPKEKPMLVVRPNVLLTEAQLDQTVSKMNKQIREGHVVLVPKYLDIVESNMTYSTEAFGYGVSVKSKKEEKKMEDTKIVRFDIWCPKCVRANEKESHPVCNKCLTVSAQPNSTKPVCFEEGKK